MHIYILYQKNEIGQKDNFQSKGCLNKNIETYVICVCVHLVDTLVILSQHMWSSILKFNMIILIRFNLLENKTLLILLYIFIKFEF